MRIVLPLFIVLSALTGCAAGSTALIDLRVATFNIAMGLPEAGQLGQNLASGLEPRLQQVAEILQRVRPDIVVLNEFDYDPNEKAADLFNVLPSTNMIVRGCGVFWPAEGEQGDHLVYASDHRLVWLDIRL